MTTRALVLGGGGVAGIAWITGVLAGLAENGADVTDADLLIGTSAGANVAVQLTRGLSTAELLRRQAVPALQNPELRPSRGLSVEQLWDRMQQIWAETSDPHEAGRRLGELALEADTVPEAARREVIASRLAPFDEWPSRPLLLVAVDAHSGKELIVTADSGIPLIDAVAASSAVPGIWPPVTIGDSRYVDGGVRSLTNADLAAGHDRVLIVAPSTDPWLDRQESALADQGARTHVITPDVDSLAAMGSDPLNPDTRTPSAGAGFTQGKAEAAQVAALWSD